MNKIFSLKSLAILSAILILNFNTTATVASAAFFDLSPNHTNYNAIIYLQNNRIIDGYPDGSFKPNNTVNRAEFLKIVLNGSNISTANASPSPFPDVPPDEWYTPFVNKAYQEGFINGYPDGSFKPNQTINKVEALKILGEVQNWQLENPVQVAPFNDVNTFEWYSAYVSFAKNHSYLEETGSYFLPANQMSRAGISEIIYRTIVPTSQANTENEIPQAPQENIDFTPVTFSITPKNYFSNITLSSEIPNTFYQNEVYVIEGKIETSAQEASAILQNENKSLNLNFTEGTEDGYFKIPVHFRNTGNFILGLIPGDNGESRGVRISVLPESSIINETSATTPKNPDFNLEYTNSQTQISLKNQENKQFKKFSFIQGGKTVSYFSRQNINEIPLNYEDFKNFSESTFSLQVQTANLSPEQTLKINSAFASAESKNFSAATHTFSKKTSGISANPPSSIRNGQKISFNATALENVAEKAYVIKPNGQVEDFNLSSSSPKGDYYGTSIIKKGGSFNFNYTPSGQGLYIIEINNEKGIAVLNWPIYVGDKIPLIPDFFDLNTRSYYKGALNLAASQNELLDLINQSRREHGLSSVSLDSQLSSLAQKHAQDMIDNNYFEHINLSGQSPNDRRIAEGIPSPVGENLSKDVSIPFSHWGLMRSAAHRKTILNEDWDQVGIGIVLNNGYLHIVEEFSYIPLTNNDLINAKSDLINEITEMRSTNNLSTLDYNENLESIAKELNDKQINGKTLLQNDLQETISNHSISGTIQLVGRTHENISTITNSLIKDENLLDSTWKKYGLDLQIDALGKIYTLLLLNN